MGIDVEFAVVRVRPVRQINLLPSSFLTKVLERPVAAQDLEIEVVPDGVVSALLGKGITYWLAGDTESGTPPLHTDYPERDENAQRILDMVPSAKVPKAWINDGHYFSMATVEELINFDYSTLQNCETASYPFRLELFQPLLNYCKENKWGWVIFRFTDAYNLRR